LKKQPGCLHGARLDALRFVVALLATQEEASSDCPHRHQDKAHSNPRISHHSPGSALVERHWLMGAALSS
jgi:hypothetical protein